MNNRAVVHETGGRAVSEARVARSISALFGGAILEALQAQGVCCEQTGAGAAGFAGGRGGGAGQGAGAVHQVAHIAPALRVRGKGVGRPGGGQVLAFERNAVAAQPGMGPLA